MPRGWYRLDNVAKMFVATHSRRDPRVFRLSCTLTEQVEPELLNRALAQAAQQFVGFQVTLHQGLFWNYLENTDKLPVAVPETEAPCAEIYGDTRKNALLYRVSYYGCRINLEVFHVLSDGTGALGFLKTILCFYLKLRYPAELADIVPDYDATAAERAQDSFKKFYNRHAFTTGSKGSAAYRLHGSLLPYDQTQYFEFHLPTAQLLAAAKALHVSATSYLGAVLMRAIYEEMPETERSRPVVVSIPVNLRNYYPSATARNFFNTIKIRHVFAGEETLETVAQAFDAALKSQLTPENIKAQMDGFEQIEHMAAVKAVPLALKNPAVRLFTWLENRKETATISNMGKIELAPPLAAHVSGFSAFCSTRNLFVTVCSYGEQMVLGAASTFRSTNILKNAARSLSRAGMELTLYATEVEIG